MRNIFIDLLDRKKSGLYISTQKCIKREDNMLLVRKRMKLRKLFNSKLVTIMEDRWTIG